MSIGVILNPVRLRQQSDYDLQKQILFITLYFCATYLRSSLNKSPYQQDI